MDAVEFVKVSKEMCFSLGCKKCPIHKIKPLGITCEYFEKENAEKIVEIVEDWWQKNKPKTNAEHVKEKLEEIGYRVELHVLKRRCPVSNSILFNDNDGCNKRNCEECQKWWDEPHEEEKE